MSRPVDPRVRAQLIVWWNLWAAILISLVLIYAMLGRKPLPASAASETSLSGLVGMVPLFVSIVLRWLVLPRTANVPRAFWTFVAGIALAETAGVLGIFFGGPYRDVMFFLGTLGIAQFVPFFARRLVDPPPERFTMRR